jgi:sarcosine/dimethylglycine N-methyltransferase
MAAKIEISAEDRVLDLGAGYGGSARYLARTFGTHVTCLNLSEVQNDRNRTLTAQQGLDGLIDVVEGNFEEVPSGDESFDVLWSQDSLLHSGNRPQVIAEAVRVMKPGAVFCFSDPMQADDADPRDLSPVLERLSLSSLGSPAFYRSQAAARGLTVRGFTDLTPHLVRHYTRVLEELERNEPRAREISGSVYVDRMKTGLGHWIRAGAAGSLVWGIFVMEKG